MILDEDSVPAHCLTQLKTRYNVMKINADVSITQLSPLQLIVFLEMILEDNSVPAHCLTQLKTRNNVMKQNADIQHRWCELVVKNKLKSCYGDLKHFLIQHQAMGVYLFGEMIISGCKLQKSLTEECFCLLETHMEPDPYLTVKSMIYGT